MAVLGLTACADQDAPGLGQPGYIGGFFGGVVSDEPNATLIGQEVLTVGGSAADAAVAVGYALAVTMPNRAGPGSHGACLVHDASLGVTEALDFVSPPTGPNGIAIPTFSRGMAALHARYGRLPWRGLIARAEQLARLGHRPSRATRAELEASWPRIASNPIARDAISNGSGKLPDEVRRWQQIQLAGILGQIRFRGAGVMYSGSFSQALHDGYQRAGASFTLADLQGYLPSWRRPAGVDVGEHRAYVLPPPVAAGIPLGQTLGQTYRSGSGSIVESKADGESTLRAWMASASEFERWRSAGALDDDQVGRLLDDDTIESLLGRPGRVPSKAFDGLPAIDTGATGFVAVDRDGMAVACGITLGGATGTGRMPANQGFFAARSAGGYWNSPVIIANDSTFQVYMAAVGDGGAAGLAGLLNTVLRSYRDGVALKNVLAEPRLAYAPQIGAIVEANGSQAQRQAAASLGVQVRQTQTLGRVNVVYCPSGLPVESDKRLCGAESDPRTFGLTALVN